MLRRDFLITGAAFLGGTALALKAGMLPARAQQQAGETFPFRLTEAEWRQRLSPDAFAVLRQESTERPYSSPLNEEKRAGVFACAGCDNELYSSAAKYDSRTGWPSFYEPISEQRIGTKIDYYLIYPRTEVHCANCGGHLGHIFDDGPPPTGKRHCINGVALAFAPSAGSVG